MTQRVTISNVEGPYTIVVQVWEEYSPDGSFETEYVTQEEIVLELGDCSLVTIWGTRGITIREMAYAPEEVVAL